MGDSISEGTIANILKLQGQAVQTDDVIAQIETDKVTIDIKAPGPGVVESLLVKENDNVTVGQAIAILAAGEGVSVDPPVQAPAPPRPPPISADPTPPTPATPPPVQTPIRTHRKPSISFPPRRTADGQQISAMPAAQAQLVLQQISSAALGLAAVAAKGVESDAAQAAGAAGGKEVDAEWKPPPRLTLTDEEMEMVELGGALP